MNNILDQRNTSNWPLTVLGVTKTTISVTMAGANGLNDVCSGQKGTGVVTDNNGFLYKVKLPGSWQAGTENVTFNM